MSFYVSLYNDGNSQPHPVVNLALADQDVLAVIGECRQAVQAFADAAYGDSDSSQIPFSKRLHDLVMMPEILRRYIGLAQRRLDWGPFRKIWEMITIWEQGGAKPSRAEFEVAVQAAEQSLNVLESCIRRDYQTDEPLPPIAPSLIQLGKQTDEPIVRGKRKKPLTFPQYNVITALLEAGEGGLGKESLEDLSGHTDAVHVLKRLKNSDPDWGYVILLAGKPYGRYRLRQTETDEPKDRPKNHQTSPEN
jgi:hypothetical protein